MNCSMLREQKNEDLRWMKIIRWGLLLPLMMYTVEKKEVLPPNKEGKKHNS